MLFVPKEKFQETIDKLKKKVTESITNTLESSNISPQDSYLQGQSLMLSFYDDLDMTMTTETQIESELHIYQNMPELPKYKITHPLYTTNNPYKWWNDHKATLPLLAE